MTRLVVPLLLALSFTNCGLDNSYYFMRNYEKDVEMTTTIGSPMLETTVEFRNNVYNVVRASTKSELVYSGKAGNVIKIVYREYSNDYARPAFSQELQYDLGETTTLKFRKTTIQVIRASNQEISFRVLESPNFRFKQGRLSKQDEELVKQN
jgi:hypothetical protein